jgi:hypothetical protein
MTGYDIEAAIIGILAKSSALAGIEKNHHDDDEDVSPNSISVSATVGAKQLDGPKCYGCECSIVYRSEASQITTDTIADAIRAAIQTAPSVAATVAELSQFSSFYILDEDMAEAREDTENLRVRSLGFPVLAVPK